MCKYLHNMLTEGLWVNTRLCVISISGFFLINIYFNCVYVCGSVWKYMQLSAGAYRDQRKASGPLKLALQAVVTSPTWRLEPNSDPLQEQCFLLTTEPSLEALSSIFEGLLY